MKYEFVNFVYVVLYEEDEKSKQMPQTERMNHWIRSIMSSPTATSSQSFINESSHVDVL